MKTLLMTAAGLRATILGMVATALPFGMLGVGKAAHPMAEAAVRKGAAYLQRQQLQDGCWQERGHRLGETALAGLALLAAGHPANSPVVTAAARAVRHLASANWKTYEVSLAVMFLDQVGVKGDSEIIRNLGTRLSTGQAADGCWTYSLDGLAGDGDNSNAQFAVLACWICRRHGAAMDDTILKADRYFRSTVNQADGGWGYTPGNRSTPTMTCAGLVALAAERGMAIERSRSTPAGKRKATGRQDGPPRDLAPDKNDPVVSAALDHLAAQLQQDRIEDQSKAFAGLYFYWSLERVGVIYGLTNIRGIDWYGWGVERLLRTQRPDGSWGSQDCVDTAFAILFLSRANVAEDLTNTLGGWGHVAPVVQPGNQDTFLRVERKPTPQSEGANK
jgi:hypothetical protein